MIGAGPSGLAAAKNALQAGLSVTVFEQADQVGGNWLFNADTGHSSVYENTHIISSKAWSEYEDFPMPESYPDYPSHEQLQRYFAAYAEHFGVSEVIRFRHRVEQARPVERNRWSITFTNAEGQTHTETFSHLMVCNGHHWDPKFPDYEGEFTGTYIHSSRFKTVPEAWRDKKVVVIGAGNSACDVAVELARITRHVRLSMRSPQWFVPKFLFGKPVDTLASNFLWAPRRFRQWVLKRLLLTIQGRHSAYGLPDPNWNPFESHPTLNQDLLPMIRHGRIQPRPAITRLDRDGVVFADGRREQADILIAATGFWVSFPFFDSELIDFRHALRVPLYRKMMHPDFPTVYFIGLFQPLGCIGPLADFQARLACEEILGNYQRPTDLHQAIENELAHPHFRWRESLRHATEVDYHAFRKDLAGELSRAGVRI